MLELYESEFGFVEFFEEACCEGRAVRATADEACQSGCARVHCDEIAASYVFQTSEGEKDCLAGMPFKVCTGIFSNECFWFQVTCAFVSNELFDGIGVVPLASLETRELCGDSKPDSLVGVDDEAGPDSTTPTWSNHRVVLDPSQTTALVEWSSSTWGHHALTGRFTGSVSYRLDTCSTGGGDCVVLRRLVVYGGDVEVDGVLASNLVMQLIDPVELPYTEGAAIEISPGMLSMLLTYQVDGRWIGWAAANSNASTGIVDPGTDAFDLGSLVFDGESDDVRLSVEVEIGGIHE
ncbi:hypothetical protein ACNOYE_27260 [Nannocystaceae bacterium ST9]